MSDDPFAALEEAAARQAAEEQAKRALAQARCRLVLGKDARSAFFATLALRLVPEVDWEAETMATDGSRLFHNPSFVAALSPDELLGVIAHEVLHCALSHHARRGSRDMGRWNTSCDLAANPLLLEGGFTLPADRLMPGEGSFAGLPTGKSAEEYYALLPAPEPPRPGHEGDAGGEGEQEGPTPYPDPDPGRCGGVRDPGKGSPAQARQSEAEWQVAVAQAHQLAKQRGELPGGLARLVEQALQPKVDWRDVLRQFLSTHARNDFSWQAPNRRFLHQGLYLPGLRSEELGDAVLAVDTSGSIGPEELSRFAAEAQAILESYDCALTVLYHDAKVQKVERWRPSDGPLCLDAVGGGGTSHVCVFDWVEAQGESPACIVCLTDLDTEFPDRAPAVPVLWAVVGGNDARPPFGLRVEVAG